MSRTPFARKFRWWWKEPGRAKAMMRLYKASPQSFHKEKAVKIPPGVKGPLPIFDFKPEWMKRPPKLTREQLETLCLEWFVKHYNECAFWYELHARREFASGMKKPAVRYAFGAPFCKLTLEQIQRVEMEWRHKVKTDGGALPKERPFAYVLSLPSQITDEKTIQSLREKAKLGWSEPGLIAFNLKECSNREILKRLVDVLKFQRQKRGIPEPEANAGKKLRTKKTGKAFTEIEALDVFTRLSVAEANKSAYDSAGSRRAKREIRREFPEINPR
jgi:hypothetical protein